MFALLENLPQGGVFSLDLQTAISIGLNLINVIVLFFVLTRLLYKPVRQFLLDRTIRIRDQITFAKVETEKVNELKAQYERLLRDIDQEKAEILDAARKLAADKTKQQLDLARSEADAIKSRAFHEIEMEQERVKEEMRLAIIDVSSALASRILSRTIDGETHENLFNETLAELEGMQWHS
jgi:F-type H+-transporting ATPase subunit b